MTTLDAATSAALSLAAVETGGSTVAMVVVAPSERAGARLLVVSDAAGDRHVHGTLGSRALDAAARDLAEETLASTEPPDGLRDLDGIQLYVEVRRPVRDLVIVGAGHIARPMARIGSDLGYRVWVLDDRPAFATRERFPDAFRVLEADFSDPFREVPIHRGTHLLLVTRGHKYDYDCLVRVLGLPTAPAYIGMIGSRRRVRATFHQLLEDGIPRRRLDAIHAPVGLDIRAETPEEIAVAVAAELVMVRRGGTGRSLRDIEDVAGRFFAPLAGEAP